jgi:hypothetical protein
MPKTKTKTVKKSAAKPKTAKSAGDEITAGSIAKELGATPGKVKKAIEELGIKPTSKKGACCYYARDAVTKIKAAIG